MTPKRRRTWRSLPLTQKLYDLYGMMRVLRLRASKLRMRSGSAG